MQEFRPRYYSAPSVTPYWGWTKDLSLASPLRADEFWKVKKASVIKERGKTERDASLMPFLETLQQTI